MTFILGAALLTCFAIVCLPWSSMAAKVALVAAICASIASLASAGQGWAFLFAIAACGCCLAGAWFLFFHTERWVHRFVIYAGYGTTFAAMSAASLRGWGIFALAGIWVVGSGAIFSAKSLTVRWAVKHVAGYRA
jgi:hypothetical protein